MPHHRRTGCDGVAKSGAGERSGDTGSCASPASLRSPDRRGVLKPLLPAPDAAVPGRPQDRGGAAHAGIRSARKFAARSAVLRMSEAASQWRRMRRGRSPRVTGYRGRGHRSCDLPARSSRIRRAISIWTSTGLRLCRRARNSAKVGRSATSLFLLVGSPTMTCPPWPHGLSACDEGHRAHYEAESSLTCD